MEERREEGKIRRGRTAKGEWNERTGRARWTERGWRERGRKREGRQRNILAGYMQYELLPKNIKNLLADGQWRLNTNHGPRARRIASWIIGLYCCTYKLVYVAMFRISLDLDIVIRISRVWLMDRYASFVAARLPVPIESPSRFFFSLSKERWTCTRTNFGRKRRTKRRTKRRPGTDINWNFDRFRIDMIRGF